MANPTTPSPAGQQQLSKSVYFVDEVGREIRPIYQRNNDTGESSYRLYPDGGNTKLDDLDVQDYRDLAKHLLEGCSVRCRVPTGESSNRSINSRDIKKLVIEIEK